MKKINYFFTMACPLCPEINLFFIFLLAYIPYDFYDFYWTMPGNTGGVCGNNRIMYIKN